MRKLLAPVMAVLFFVVGLLVVLPTNASAQEANSDSTLRHAYKPVVLSSISMMQARVNNHANVAQKRLVCVEAFKTVTNAKTHLGCLWLDLAAWGSTGMYAMEFNVPLWSLASGSYNVVYTFQSGDGSWNRIKSIEMKVQDGMYTAP